MNSSNVPWNQVAIIRPSGCQTVRKRSHRRASRHTAQFSTSSRIVSLSASIHSPRGFVITRSPSVAWIWQSEIREAAKRAGSDVAAFDLFTQRLDDVGEVLEVRIDR